MAVGSTLSALSIIFTVAVVSARTTVSDVEWESFRLLNELRKAGFTCPNGANYPANDTPLLFDCRLWRAAYLHSEDMAKNNYFSHYSKDGRSPWDRAKAQANGAFIANAENIAINSVQAVGAIEAWKRSDGHCRGMMNASRTSMGVGSYERHWTQMLGGQNANQVDTSCYPDNGGGGSPVATPTPAPTDIVSMPTPAPVNGGGNNAGVPIGIDGQALVGIFDPTRCPVEAENSGPRGGCAKCITNAQCADAYGQGWFCCPYMKKCINSSSMPCYTPTARCNPRCFANNFDEAMNCGGCDWDLDNWVDGCSKAEWESWNVPVETPAPTDAPTAAPETPSPTAAVTEPEDGFSSLAEFKVYCGKLGDDKEACSACGGKFQAKKGKCKLAKSARKVKCKKIKSDDVCSKLGCGLKNSKCNGKPQNIL